MGDEEVDTPSGLPLERAGVSHGEPPEDAARSSSAHAMPTPPPEPKADATPTDGGCPATEILGRMLREGDEAASPEVRRHLARCEACRSRLTIMREGEAFLSRFAPRSGPRAADDVLRPVDPDEFDGFVVEEMIQVGGQGAIYRARERSSGEMVAIKIPLVDSLRHPARRYRLEREVELASRLDHPSIVRMRGLCRGRRGSLALVMDFVEGTPFDEWAARERGHGRTGVRRIIEAMVRVADAIATAHRHAVLHRDLKPSNVIVDRQGNPRVLDFGLAKALDGSGESFATITGAFVGTPAFAAPEQLDPATDRGDVRSDVWGLGMLLYMALAGKPPWDPSGSGVALARAIREQTPSRPTASLSTPEAELDAIVLKSLSKAPIRRYEAAAAFGDDLQRWLDGRPVAARFDSRWYVIRKTAWRHRVAIGVGAIGCAVLFSILWMADAARIAARNAASAAAIRDARTVEWHWARVAEARQLAGDDFHRGESVAWSAFLDADPAIERAGLSGPGSLEGVPRNPAYWALWEIYAGMPVIASLHAEATMVVIDDSEHGLLGAVGVEEVRWWTTSTLAEVGHRSRATIESGPTRAIDGKTTRFLAFPSADTVTVSDYRLGPVATLRHPRLLTATASSNAIVLLAGGSADSLGQIQVHDLKEGTPSLRFELDLEFPPHQAVIDASEKLLVVRGRAEGVAAIDLESGARLPLPRIGPSTLINRGVPGKVIVLFESSAMEISCLDGTLRTTAIEAAGLMNLDLESMFHATCGSLQSVHITSRWIAYRSVGSASARPPSRLRGLRISRGAFVDNDTKLACQIRMSPRVAFVDNAELDGHLRTESLDPESGSATTFAVAFSEDGRTLVTGSIDGRVAKFDVLSGIQVSDGSAVDPEHGITRMAVDGDAIYLGTHDHARNDASVRRFHPDGRSTPLLHPAECAWICGLAVDPGKYLWSLDGVGRLRRYELPSGAMVAERSLRTKGVVVMHCLARLPHRRVLIPGGIGLQGGLQLRDEATLEDRSDPLLAPLFRSIAANPIDPDLIATGHLDGRIRIWRMAEDPMDGMRLKITKVREFGSHAGEIFALAFHPSGRLLVSGSGSPEDRPVRIWDPENGRELAAVRWDRRGVFALAFSPDGRWLAIGGEPAMQGLSAESGAVLIDMSAPERAMVGNLAYQLQSLSGTERDGRVDETVARLRERVR